MKAYVASGWFTPEQEAARLLILKALEKARIDVYSPKDDLIYVPGKDDPSIVFEANIIQIDQCDLMVASTEGKDMGTLFECGFAYSIGKPIIYLWTRPEPLNLMLSESSHHVSRTYSGLVHYLKKYKQSGGLTKTVYKGEVE